MSVPRSYHKSCVRKELAWSSQIKQTIIYLEKSNMIYMFVETIDPKSNTTTRCIHYFIDKIIVETLDVDKENGNFKYKQLISQGFDRVGINYNDLIFF